MTQIKRQLPTLADIRHSDIIFYPITKEDVMEKDFSGIDDMVNVLRQAKKHARGKVDFNFMYDSDYREIYEIDEIRQYVQEMILKFPEIFYYFSLHNHGCITAIIACLSKIDNMIDKGETKHINMRIDKELFEKIINNAQRYMYEIGDASSDSQAILDMLNYCI